MQFRVAIAIAILLCGAGSRAADTPALLSALPTIPDVGEPFDVKISISVPFSYRNNAFTLYRHAESSYVIPPVAFKTLRHPGVRFKWNAFNNNLNETLEKGWDHANAAVRDWLEANEFALAIWHRGTLCGESIDVPPGDLRVWNIPKHFRGLQEFSRLACLKAVRDGATGKPADAWKWQVATLRSSVHVAMHAGLAERLASMAIYNLAADSARSWAGRREVSASDLRQALMDTLAVNASLPPVSEAIKGDYLTWRRPSDRNEGLKQLISGFPRLFEIVGYEERARRVLNVVYANLLSQADRPRFLRTPLPGNLPLFGRGGSAPWKAKVYADEEIERKMLAFPVDFKIAERMLPFKSMFDALDSQRTYEAALVLSLGLQVHHRKHGQFPANLDELVKEGYLPSIPPDPFGKGEPFHYRPDQNPRQGAILWSVWWDEIDQRGELDAWSFADGRTGDRIFKVNAPR
jgi:hypothetical protein